MGRRSDHTRAEIEAMFIAEGHRQLAELGLARFTARDVAKQVGYSVGTLYNVFGSYDGLLTAINGRTLELWAEDLRARLEKAGDDRIGALVRGYFEFAGQNHHVWLAVYEHHMADGSAAPRWYEDLVTDLMRIVAGEIIAVLPGADSSTALSLASSLAAVVHGHCLFAVYRTFELLGETAPAEVALARVREVIGVARQGIAAP